MCGIVGYIGKEQAAPILLEGLERLEYRGYDSAGICVAENGVLDVAKCKGRLANLAEIFALFVFGVREAFAVSLVRVFLISLLFGNAVGWIYSVAGALLSLLVMLALRATGKFSVLGISVAGGVSHNVGQILAAMVVLRSEGVLYYLPPLLLSGTVAGAVIGIASALLIDRLGKYVKM
mgnify:CR=1 FL=1